MRQTCLTIFFFCIGFVAFAQQKIDSLAHPFPDSLATYQVQEVLIIGNPSGNYLQENKALGSIDSYLANHKSINMIRRGAYAWEPMLNGMSTERSVLTIDGMRIFHACTDKMDPITSYVENTNLSSAKIEDGQSGSEYGNTIAGSIDLVRRKSGFTPERKFGGSVFSGFESNNRQQIYGATLHHSSSNFFADIDFTHRNAGNYKAGRDSGQSREVLYSQFTKYNVSAVSGIKINAKQELEASLIYDKASDVGYPGLPMDVSLAEATIASLQYSYRNISNTFHDWETKVYYNTIIHIMDDSHRPVVPIRMDMPGWSKTGGFYTKVTGAHNKHSFKSTLSGYYNNSLAEMTMYPNDPEEKEMYMLTWPDVNTLYSGLHLDDYISLNTQFDLRLRGGIAVQHNSIQSDWGLNSLRLFYPELISEKTRVLKNISSTASYYHNNFRHQLGIAYGERAPSVSEGYGFYLLNVNDNYDYIGNPYLVNEKSLNAEFASTYVIEKLTVKAKANYFYILDYIIGKPHPNLWPMNMTAYGIKIYEQLDYASIFNASLGTNFRPFDYWSLSADASYRYGQGAENTVLPLIQPLSYTLGIKYSKDSFFAEASLDGSTKNRNSIEFGETQKPAYTIVNLAISKSFNIKNQRLTLKAGVENLFDRYYSTFDNWFGIPRMGRNIYVNVIYKF